MTYLTPKDIATSRGVDIHTVLQWIRAGELRAVNLGARRDSRKPRWKIAPADLAAFEASRAATPEAKPAARRRQPGNVTQYF